MCSIATHLSFLHVSSSDGVLLPTVSGPCRWVECFVLSSHCQLILAFQKHFLYVFHTYFRLQEVLITESVLQNSFMPSVVVALSHPFQKCAPKCRFALREASYAKKRICRSC
uniref:Secreted protein n=1 Tax=Steinernema glaseri TaxID=37863 RepID=A0A1I7XXX8_9BILA